MKALFGWLSDPFLHLLGIGVIVLVIGSQMMNSPKSETFAEIRCRTCLREHGPLQVCPNSETPRGYVAHRP